MRLPPRWIGQVLMRSTLWPTSPSGTRAAAVSRFGVVRLEVATRPIAPTLVQVVEVDEQRQQLGMAVVCALHVANRDVVARAGEQMDRVAGPNVTRSLDRQVCAGPPRFGEAAYEGSIAHPDAELEARYAWLGDASGDASDLPPLADDCRAKVDPGEAEVL